ncbi:MAG TPA: hypothetical protein VK716_08930 [Terracidiphilus sp.]|jgi:hypothetical protein|nr:hypothetical protein [Terracidiphilus sp.]
MKLSGSLRFEDLNPSELHFLRAFEDAHMGEYEFEYGFGNAVVTIGWQNFHGLSALTHLAADVEVLRRKQQCSPTAAD